MLRRALLGGLAVAVLTAPALAQTVDEVIAKSLEARGGLDKLKAVRSIRMTGKMTMGPGMEAPVTIEMKRPRNARIEFTIQGSTGVQAYDGQQAWGISPLGSQQPEPMPAEMAKELDDQADLDGPLVDYKEAGAFLWPYSIQSGAKGRPEKQSLVIETIEVNPTIDDARFKMPAPKPAEPPKQD